MKIITIKHIEVQIIFLFLATWTILFLFACESNKKMPMRGGGEDWYLYDVDKYGIGLIFLLHW